MTSIDSLVLRLRTLGVRVWAEPEGLRYKGPRGALTADLLAEMKQRKDEILAFLRDAESMTGTAFPPIEPTRERRRIPLSYAQQRLWFMYRMEGPNPAYNILQAFQMEGSLDRAAFQSAVDSLVRRHDSLRTYFREEKGMPFQVIEDQADIDFRFVDLQSLSAEDRHAELERIKSAAALRSFVLEQLPLTALTLVQVEPQVHVCILVMSHITSDGWSLGVAQRELAEFYDANRRNVSAELPPPKLQYADFACWQRQWIDGDFLKQRLDHWRKYLHDAPPLLNLRPGRPRPAETSYRGDTHAVELAPPLANKLTELCRQSGASMYMTLLAAFKILLQRYSSQDDILVGTQVANRDRSELEPLIGFFVNTIVTRTNLGGSLTFNELLARVRQSALTAFSLQDTPFEKVVEVMQPDRDASYNPLVQVMFLWQNAPMGELQLSDLTITPLPLKYATAKFDLTLELAPRDGGISGLLEYRTDVFKAREIERMADHFRRLLETLVEHPENRISALPLTSQIGVNDVTTEPQNAIADSWMQERTIHAAFQAQVERTPDAIAIGASVPLTYAELNRRANQLARYLQTVGVGPECPVGILLPRSPEFIVSILAVLKAGGAYLPLDPSYPKDRIDVILADARPAAVISDAARRNLLPADATVVCLDRDAAKVAKRGSDNLQVRVRGKNLAYIIFTSGSTGKPKGVMIEHCCVLNLVNALQAVVYAKYDRPLRVAQMASFVFDASVQQIFACLLQGHTLYVPDSNTRIDAEALARYLAENEIDISDCTPSLLAIMAAGGLSAAGRRSLKHLVVGGEALPIDLVAKFREPIENQQIRITNVYGPTECCVDVTSFDLECLDDIPNVVPLGKPLANTSIYVFDSFGNLQPEGLSGELFIAGAGVARGYLNDPAQSQRFLPDPFSHDGRRMYATGDLGYRNESGDVEFLGRNDDQIKIRGYRIELGEVEACLCSLPDVRQAIVVVHRSGTSGDKELLAYLVADADQSVDELRRNLAVRLPEYMIPSRFVMLDRIPLNDSGKVDRRNLPDPAIATSLRQDVEYVEPRDEREACVVEVWKSVIGVDRVGIKENFFAAGGDSIKALQVVARLRDLNWKLQVRDVFNHPTAEKMAAVLDPVTDSMHPEARGEGAVPLTAIQRRFFHDHESAAHFNQAVILAPRQQLDVDALRNALHAVCEHHDTLSLRFHHDGRQWVQQYGTGASVDFQIVTLQDNLAGLAEHAQQVQESFDLVNGPLLKAVLYRRASGDDRLLIVAHHIVIDGVSWRVILEDIQRAYEQIRLSQAIKLPARTDSFQKWSLAMQRFAQSEVLDELDYWKHLEATPLPPLPADDTSAATRYKDLGHLKLQFSEQETRHLQFDVHRAYATEINDILLAAVARAVQRWSGHHRVGVMLEGHGREPLFETVDVSRTVGWFTSVYPVVFDVADTEDIGRHVKIVKETLRKVPRKGVGYGVLRYLTSPKLRGGLEFQLDPRLSFNFLGQFGTDSNEEMFLRADEAIGASIDPNATPPYDIELVGMIVGGRLEFDLVYSQQRFQLQNITLLRDALVSELQEVIGNTCGKQESELTPSDIDYDGFDIQQLEKFINDL